jgi:hypothetical protein
LELLVVGEIEVVFGGLESAEFPVEGDFASGDITAFNRLIHSKNNGAKRSSLPIACASHFISWDSGVSDI